MLNGILVPVRGVWGSINQSTRDSTLQACWSQVDSQWGCLQRWLFVQSLCFAGLSSLSARMMLNPGGCLSWLWPYWLKGRKSLERLLGLLDPRCSLCPQEPDASDDTHDMNTHVCLVSMSSKSICSFWTSQTRLSHSLQFTSYIFLPSSCHTVIIAGVSWGYSYMVF